MSEFFALFVADGRPQVLNLDQPVADEYHLGHVCDTGDSGIADQLRIQGQQSGRFLRVRISQPRRNLQIKVNRPVSGHNDFVAYDAIGELDGTRRLLEWKTAASRYSLLAGSKTKPDLDAIGARIRKLRGDIFQEGNGGLSRKAACRR